MKTLWSVLGVVLVLVGLIWVGQGLNVFLGSTMSGQPIYAALGLIVASIGVWLVTRALRSARPRDL
jgi:hypothetical protein